MASRIRTVKEVQERLAAMSGQTGKWRWYHGLAFYLIVQVLTFSLSGLVSVATGNRGRSTRETFFGDVGYFTRLKQAKIAPPSWAFGPAWTINNLSTIWGTLRVLNKPEGTPGRNAFLTLQGITWLEFVSFNAAYFSLRSPINALVLTATFFVFTIISELIAIFQLKDTRVALSLGTLLIWLTIATTAATAQALWNEDDLYDVGPFVEPNPVLVKETVQ
jgi:tryptophan-rich sensory protein